MIGPRTPFAQDSTTFDYSYDSGEDWEEEEEGGEDIVSASGSDNENASEADSDIDSWLDDDDPGLETDLASAIRAAQSPPPMPPTTSKGKPDSGKRKGGANTEDEPQAKKTGKKRKVVPLVPFNKGPCWEKEVGKAVYRPFDEYHVHLLNGKEINSPWWWILG